MQLRPRRAEATVTKSGSPSVGAASSRRTRSSFVSALRSPVSAVPTSPGEDIDVAAIERDSCLPSCASTSGGPAPRMMLFPQLGVPDYLREKYVLSQYRGPGMTVRDCANSIFSWHNETLNVWTHMVGFFIMLGLLVYCAFYLSPTAGIITDQHVVLNRTHPLTNMTQAVHAAPHVAQAHGRWEAMTQLVQEVKSHWVNFEGALEHRIDEIEHTVEAKLAELRTAVTDMMQHMSETFPQVSTARAYGAKLVTEFEDVVQRSHVSDAVHAVETAFERLGSYIFPSHVSRWPLFIYLLCAMCCLGASTLYHLFGCCSHKAYYTLARCDYSGIALLIAGSCVPAFYYGFYCHTAWKVAYLCMMCSIGAVVVTLCNLEWFYQAKLRVLRALMFVSMGLFGAVPAAHMVHLVGKSMVFPFFSYMGGMACCYLAGVALYATRIPERYAPGKFDLVGHSHQIFHVLVVVAALFHYAGCIYIHNVLTMYSCDAVF